MNRRDFYIQYLEELLLPLKKCYNVGEKFGDVESNQGDNISWFEMFARSMYGIVAYTSAVGNNTYVQIFNDTIHKVVEHTYYKKFQDYDQKNVELIPIALMLFIHKDLTWNQYTIEQKKIIANWIENVATSAVHNNNWQFFRIIVCEILTCLIGKQYTNQVDESWKIVDDCYTGKGWYVDGFQGPKDYYISWGYQFYSLLHLYLFPNKVERNEIIESRVEDFANDYWQMFDNEGRSIPYGRSLIYRFASLSFWSMYLLTGHKKIKSKDILYLIEKNISWWRSQNIVTNGILNLGYAYRNEFLCENYNSSGSVYWVFKFFFILLIDKENPIWQIPIETKIKAIEGIYTIANEDIIIERNKTWNVAYPNLRNGSSHSQNTAKYMRFAYNSACGFNLSKNITDFSNLSDDSSLVFNIAGVKHQRENNDYSQQHNGMMEYRWKCGNLIKVKTYVIPLHKSYCRIHLIKSNITCFCYETGFSIKSDNLQVEQKEDQITIRNNQYVSSMKCLFGEGLAKVITNENNSNLYHRHTAMPTVQYCIIKGVNVIADCTIFSDTLNDEELENQLQFHKKKKSFQLDNGNKTYIIPYSVSDAVLLLVTEWKEIIMKKVLEIYLSNKILKSIYRKFRSLW